MAVDDGGKNDNRASGSQLVDLDVRPRGPLWCSLKRELLWHLISNQTSTRKLARRAQPRFECARTTSAGQWVLAWWLK